MSSLSACSESRLKKSTPTTTMARLAGAVHGVGEAERGAPVSSSVWRTPRAPEEEPVATGKERPY